MGKIGLFVGIGDVIGIVVGIGPVVGIGLFGGTDLVVSLTYMISKIRSFGIYCHSRSTYTIYQRFSKTDPVHGGSTLLLTSSLEFGVSSSIESPFDSSTESLFT